MPRRGRTIPSEDSAFAQAAAAALARLDGTLELDQIEGALADALRDEYPAVQVRRQDKLARVLDFDLWYAYRDGRPFGATDPA